MKHKLVYETDNFLVEAFTTSAPHVSRSDGGHLRIVPKVHYENRWNMSPEEAIEYVRLSMIVGEALKIAMNNIGIPVVRINYHDMGNWAVKKNIKPYFHMNVYGRAENAKTQVWPEAVYLPDRSTGFYDNFEPLNDEDIKEIRKQIMLIMKQDKYKDAEWIQ